MALSAVPGLVKCIKSEQSAVEFLSAGSKVNSCLILSSLGLDAVKHCPDLDSSTATLKGETHGNVLPHAWFSSAVLSPVP